MTKRSKSKYPGLDLKYNAKLRHEFIDHDYIDKLSDKEKQWLSNFNEEDLSGNFKHKGKKLYKDPEDKRKCYSRNNSRNRDIYGIKKVTGYLYDLKAYAKKEENMLLGVNLDEDAIIELLDKAKKKTPKS